MRLDFGRCEIAREALDLFLFRAEIEVHEASIWLSCYDMSVIANSTFMLFYDP
jgi:hypothetical protein